MDTFIFILSVLLWPLCIMLIGLILLQGGAGDLSSAFGGGGQLDSALGVGAGRKMSKLTAWLGAAFLAIVTILAVHRPTALPGVHGNNAKEQGTGADDTKKKKPLKSIDLGGVPAGKPAASTPAPAVEPKPVEPPPAEVGTPPTPAPPDQASPPGDGAKQDVKAIDAADVKPAPAVRPASKPALDKTE